MQIIRSRTQYDVCIVGSGAGGGMAAKVLTEAGWIEARGDGTSNRYRLDLKGKDAAARKLWSAVREEAEALPAARRDTDRVKAVLADRHTRSQAFFASSAAQWDRVRAELFVTKATPFPSRRRPSIAAAAPGTGSLPRYRTPSRSNRKAS